MNTTKDLLTQIFQAVEGLYGVWVYILFYFLIKKCFWNGTKNRAVLLLVTIAVNPLTLYLLTTLIGPVLLSGGIKSGAIPFIAPDHQNQAIAIVTMISSVAFLALVIAFSNLVGKWLTVPNKELVTFVFLMHSIVTTLSMWGSLDMEGEHWLFNVSANIFGFVALIAAGICLYCFIAEALSTLAKERHEINAKLFIVPPAVFMILYSVFLMVSALYKDAYPFREGAPLILLFSICILYLFMWAFHIIIRNINATNEAIRAKALAAEMAVEEAKIEADLSIAKSIQTSALPRTFPPFPGRKDFELFASMNAAREVGGDFYDFYMPGENTLGFLVADVSGKGIPAAMFMMTGKTIIKSLAENGLPPAEVFTAANEKLCEGNDAELFITAWMGFLDLETGLVRVANAGHNPPVLIRDGKAEYVVLKPGLMLAGMDGMVYKEQTLQLQRGDILFLYTDGVTEAMDAGENQYGESRLQKLLSFGGNEPEPAGENGTAGAVCQLVAKDVEAFVQGAEQSDDITMLCIRYLGNP